MVAYFRRTIMYLEISNPMDYHAALYIRLSKEDESEGPSQSVTNQKSLLDEFVQKHRLQVYDTYIDDGWSGTNFDRPDFQRMIGDIEAKKVNMVITKDLSRLGRDYIMTATIWSGTSQKSGCDTFPCWTVSTPAWSPQPTTLRRSGPS